MHPLCVYYILWSARHSALDMVSLQENHKNALESLENWGGGGVAGGGRGGGEVEISRDLRRGGEKKRKRE